MQEQKLLPSAMGISVINSRTVEVVIRKCYIETKFSECHKVGK